MSLALKPFVASSRRDPGRGGSGIKYYEVSDGDEGGPPLPQMNFCHEYKASGDPLSGVAVLPPHSLDVPAVEVARLLRLTPTSVEPGQNCC